MGEVRRNRQTAQVRNVRDGDTAPLHLSSAGENLIRDLVSKQTSTTISLQEQLAHKHNFVPGGSYEGIRSGGITTQYDVCRETIKSDEAVDNEQGDPSLSQLQQRSGLSRELLEERLAVKPNSMLTKLYKFALNNSVKNPTSENLLDQLPNHPINNLKSIEGDFMATLSRHTPPRKKRRKRGGFVPIIDPGVSSEPEPCSSVNNQKIYHKKRRRKRRKKIPESECMNPEINVDVVPKVEKPVSVDPNRDEPLLTNSSDNPPNTKRPSLWDVKDMRAFCQSTVKTCEPPKMYTIKDGKIVQVNDTTDDERHE